MAFALEKDWPIVAAGAMAALGAVVLSRGGGGSGGVGGGGVAGYEEAIAAQMGVAQAQIAGLTSLAESYGQVARTRIEARALIRIKQIEAGLAAQQISAGIFSQIIGGIFGFFSYETTAQALRGRRAAHRRMALAYGG